MVMYLYMVMTLLIGGLLIWKGGIYPGIAGIVGPTLSWFAAAGLKGSLMVGATPQKLAGLGLAGAFLAVGIGLVYHSGYWVEIFGYQLSGISWCIIGFIVGWASTTREHATAKAFFEKS